MYYTIEDLKAQICSLGLKSIIPTEKESTVVSKFTDGKVDYTTHKTGYVRRTGIGRNW